MQQVYPSNKQMEREMAILNTPSYLEARGDFVRYVCGLQQARSDPDSVCRLSDLAMQPRLEAEQGIEAGVRHEATQDTSSCAEPMWSMRPWRCTSRIGFQGRS